MCVCVCVCVWGGGTNTLFPVSINHCVGRFVSMIRHKDNSSLSVRYVESSYLLLYKMYTYCTYIILHILISILYDNAHIFRTFYFILSPICCLGLYLLLFLAGATETKSNFYFIYIYFYIIVIKLGLCLILKVMK